MIRNFVYLYLDVINWRICVVIVFVVTVYNLIQITVDMHSEVWCFLDRCICSGTSSKLYRCNRDNRVLLLDCRVLCIYRSFENANLHLQLQNTHNTNIWKAIFLFKPIYLTCVYTPITKLVKLMPQESFHLCNVCNLPSRNKIKIYLRL